MESREVLENPDCGPLTDQISPLQSECLATAVELCAILRQEAEVLKRFAGPELMGLLPRKEYLVIELQGKLEALKETGTGPLKVSGPLKTILREIDKLNVANGVFIRESLSYWRGLLEIFFPPGYGPGGKALRCPALPPKGWALRREI
jgi:hypothetical protein